MAKAGKPGSGGKRRREEIRRTLGKPSFEFASILEKPERLTATGLVLLFCLLMSIVTVWSRGEIKVRVGQVMDDTRLTRVEFDVVNETRTNEARERARNAAPPVFTLNVAYLERLRGPLLNLPLAASGVEDIEALAPEFRQPFNLDASGLERMRAFVVDDQPSAEWRNWVDGLLSRTLIETPMLERSTWEKQLSRAAPPVLRTPDGDAPAGTWRRAVRYEPGERDANATAFTRLARDAGFPNDVASYIAARLATGPEPTFLADQPATETLAEEAALAVPALVDVYEKGHLIYRRGDTLDPSQYQLLLTEAERFAAAEPWASRVRNLLGVAGLITLLMCAAAAYIALFYPKIVRNPWRVAAIGGLMTLMLSLSVLLATEAPNFFLPATIAPTLIVAIVLLLAYGQRLSLFVAAMQAALAAFAMESGLALFILLFASCGAAVSQLREMRHRSTLIRASTVTAVVCGVGAVLYEMVRLPYPGGGYDHLLIHAAQGVASAYVVGFLVLGMLPSIERMFDITTGMTLAELRDPKQPLLKQLQQKAPGTYNHSLQVANIAEAASEAIGADGLLVYVGAMYHDIGKMNKPEYFVENQGGAFNRHEKLSPTMSMLVIIGHVKDGIELAKEYNLPRQIQQFIGTHHGTTLVEYFYHQAKTKAESEKDREKVEEVEFRYPGPKPRSKEAAILMLSDCVESAARTLADPTPGRIESLVRALSRKRLEDGQFDQSDLTFRELGKIEDAIIKSMCAIYHSRITYPSKSSDETSTGEAKTEVKSA